MAHDRKEIRSYISKLLDDCHIVDDRESIASEWEFHLTRLYEQILVRVGSPSVAWEKAVEEFGGTSELESEIELWQATRGVRKAIFHFSRFTWTLILVGTVLGVLQAIQIQSSGLLEWNWIAGAGAISFISVYLLSIVLRWSHFNAMRNAIGRFSLANFAKLFVTTFVLVALVSLSTKVAQRWYFEDLSSHVWVNGIFWPWVITLGVLMAISLLPLFWALIEARFQRAATCKV